MNEKVSKRSPKASSVPTAQPTLNPELKPTPKGIAIMFIIGNGRKVPKELDTLLKYHCFIVQ